ncbi:MAG TPA: alpha/beta fold hydrolase [Burkholderiales bacterium]
MSGTPDFPCNAALALPGPAGALEALTTCPAANAAAASAIICHPHPLQGGTMQNKVVHTLARAFDELGLRTVRFNFRGVGASAGGFANGIGETEDVLAVLDWVRTRRPNDQLWLAGFSFGAFMALRAAAQFPVTQLVLVAPPVNFYPELGPAPAPRVPALVLQGEADDVVPAADVTAWVERLPLRPRLRLFPGVGHFFHGRLNDLRNAVHEALGPAVPR